MSASLTAQIKFDNLLNEAQHAFRSGDAAGFNRAIECLTEAETLAEQAMHGAMRALT